MTKIFALSTRNIKNYLRDRSAVFFSFLSVLILFFIYLLYLANSLKSGLDNTFYYSGFDVNEKLIKIFVDIWMVAGVVGVGCITIANGSLNNLVNDTLTNKSVDFYVTPTSRLSIVVSYLIGTVFISSIMNIGMFVITYIYLLFIGMNALSFGTLFTIAGLIILSCISASMIMLTFALIIKSETAYSAMSTVLGVVVGFATGGYMPVSMFPNFIANLCALIPGTSSVALLRNFYMKSIFESLGETVPQSVIDSLYENYGLELYIGNWNIPQYAMVIYLGISIFVFLGIAYMIVRKRKNK